MSKDPAVLFYTSDFLSGISFFSYEERGQYITLLCQQHQKWTIPFNHMISVCGSVDSVVFKKFTKDDDGNYYNERMRKEAELRKNYCNSRSNNKSGRPKKEIIRKSYENHMGNHMEDVNEDVNKDKKKKVFKKPTAEEVDKYCKERKNTVDGKYFVDKYDGNGWMVGKNKMKDWKAVVRTWEKNNFGDNQGNKVVQSKRGFEEYKEFEKPSKSDQEKLSKMMRETAKTL